MQAAFASSRLRQFKSLRPFWKAAAGLSALVFLLLVFVGWGATGHRIINKNVGLDLPPEMAGFLQRAWMLADSASNADNRKSKDPNEGAKHFIDIDDYPEFATKSVSHSLDSLIQKYGSARVNTDGVNPWATVTTMDSLTAQMKRGDWNRVWSSAADLGHYVGDAHQPLHCTANYDGLKTGNRGVHSRYESGMVDQFQLSFVVHPGQVTFIDRPIDYIFDYTYQSNSYCDTIFTADNYAKQVSGWNGSGQEPASYYSALWDKAGNFTILQIQRAVDAFASLLYTSWVNAGRPPVPALTDVSPLTGIPAEFKLRDAFPNPFNPTTTISYQLTTNGFVTLKVFDVLGREVGTLVGEMRSAGSYTVRFDGASLSSGAYFYCLEVRPVGDTRGGLFVETKKLMLLK